MAKWIAYYRNGNDPVKRSANVKAIQESAPAAWKALNAARKYNNPVNANATNSYHF